MAYKGKDGSCKRYRRARSGKTVDRLESKKLFRDRERQLADRRRAKARLRRRRHDVIRGPASLSPIVLEVLGPVVEVAFSPLPVEEVVVEPEIWPVCRDGDPEPLPASGSRVWAYARKLPLRERLTTSFVGGVLGGFFGGLWCFTAGCVAGWLLTEEE